MMKRVELLSPAGDMERLELAVKFGADAVYVGGTQFGMRSNPSNFDPAQLQAACKLVHAAGKKLYLTCNTLPRSYELDALPDFLRSARAAGVDAFIIADMGVLAIAKQAAPEVEVHISTQAGIVNYAAANAFYQMGAKRIVTARELSLDEIKMIRDHTPPELEIEAFVHGAMCMSFSGRCILSDYMVGRDANRGDCAQPCRWKYHLMEETRPGQYFPINQEENGTYIFNSKDLCMIEHIPELVAAGVDSFKIEGRAKSAYYTAVVTHAYRQALDAYFAHPSPDFRVPDWVLAEMEKMSHRVYTTGFNFGKDDLMLAYNGAASYRMNADLVPGALFALGVPVIFVLHGVVDFLAHGVCQHQCCAAGSVDLLIMVLFHNLNIKVRSQYIDRFLC